LIMAVSVARSSARQLFRELGRGLQVCCSFRVKFNLFSICLLTYLNKVRAGHSIGKHGLMHCRLKVLFSPPHYSFTLLVTSTHFASAVSALLRPSRVKGSLHLHQNLSTPCISNADSARHLTPSPTMAFEAQDQPALTLAFVEESRDNLTEQVTLDEIESPR
jgi:hypothetical protein